MKSRLLPAASLLSLLAGCGGFFESTIPAPQAYVLRLPARAPVDGAPRVAGSVLVQRPEAGPGLDSDRIALLRTGARFDFYAATRWAAAAPDMLESVIVDQLHGAGMFGAVLDDTSPYPPTYNLRCEMRRFEADYTQGGRAPTIHVVLQCSLGRHRDRALLGHFAAGGSSPAEDDRVGEVVAAFGRATAAAIAELERQTAAALAAEPALAAGS